jgi:predicted transcriptional regulator
MTLASSRPRRSQVDIIIEILAVASREGATKTALVYKSNLNFTLVQKYVDLLQRRGFLDKVLTFDGGATYRTTAGGAEALKTLRRAMNMLFFEDSIASVAEEAWPLSR